jgi:hypothetical protein
MEQALDKIISNQLKNYDLQQIVKEAYDEALVEIKYLVKSRIKHQLLNTLNEDVVHEPKQKPKPEPKQKPKPEPKNKSILKSVNLPPRTSTTISCAIDDTAQKKLVQHQNRPFDSDDDDTDIDIDDIPSDDDKTVNDNDDNDDLFID